MDVQFAVDAPQLPTAENIRDWAVGSFDENASGELTVRIVGKDEIQKLNMMYRKIDKPTNVLSFPADWETEDGSVYIGDIAICAEVLTAEAKAQVTPLQAQWAHMVVHGVLHLCGYDHQNTIDAEKMEAQEVVVLAQFGFASPY